MTNYIFPPSSSIATNKSQRIQRILYGVLVGVIVGSIAAITSSFINVWLYPDLPIFYEWSPVFLAWVLWALLGGLVAGTAVISSEGWTSILLSAFVMAATILIINFVQDIENIFLYLLILLGLALPFTAIMTPLAYLFFWLTRRFVQAMELKGWVRGRIFVANFLVILVLGAIPGLYARWTQKTNRACALFTEFCRKPHELHLWMKFIKLF